MVESRFSFNESNDFDIYVSAFLYRISYLLKTALIYITWWYQDFYWTTEIRKQYSSEVKMKTFKTVDIIRFWLEPEGKLSLNSSMHSTCSLNKIKMQSSCDHWNERTIEGCSTINNMITKFHCHSKCSINHRQVTKSLTFKPTYAFSVLPNVVFLPHVFKWFPHEHVKIHTNLVGLLMKRS